MHEMAMEGGDLGPVLPQCRVASWSCDLLNEMKHIKGKTETLEMPHSE